MATEGIVTPAIRNKANRYIVLVLWILLGVFYTCLAYNYIVVSNKDQKLDDYLQYIVLVCGDDHRPNKEIRSLILIRADQLGLKLRPDQVAITGSGQTLNIAVSYTADINFPMFNQSIYHKVFRHSTAYRSFR